LAIARVIVATEMNQSEATAAAIIIQLPPMTMGLESATQELHHELLPIIY